jgi:hypothetical protein
MHGMTFARPAANLPAVVLLAASPACADVYELLITSWHP